MKTYEEYEEEVINKMKEVHPGANPKFFNYNEVHIRIITKVLHDFLYLLPKPTIIDDDELGII